MTIATARNGVFANAGVRYSSAQRGSLSDQDLERVQVNFQRSDKNIDFVLDMWEFNNFTKFMLGRRLNEIDLMQLFGILDGNKDGQITMEDLIHHLENRFRTPSKGTMEYAFCTYDKNEDGRLYLHETRQALYFLGYPGGHKKIKEIFYKYDRDHDHQINFHEFEEIIKKEMPALSAH